ncbi:MAG: hypothetical protein ACXVJW_13580 [Acidimicrobiia bacterium]
MRGFRLGLAGVALVAFVVPMSVAGSVAVALPAEAASIRPAEVPASVDPSSPDASERRGKQLATVFWQSLAFVAVVGGTVFMVSAYKRRRPGNLTSKRSPTSRTRSGEGPKPASHPPHH